MSSRSQIKVTRLSPSPQKIQAAMERASEKVGKMVVWQERRVDQTAQTKKEGQ